MKAHEQFKSYSLAKLVGILKSHESVVSKETNVVSSLGSLALISKGKSVVEEEEELDLADYDLTVEENALMVSNPSETSSPKSETHAQRLKQKANIHKTPKQVLERKHKRNLRYKKNITERKQFWRSKNPHYVRYEKTNK